MPIMNKTGYSMYWNSMWDDKINYTRSFKEDILIKMFFNLFIEGGYLFIVRYKIKDMDKHLKMLKNNYNLHILKKKKDENRFNYFLDKKKKSDPYLARVWLLKYQTWIIFYIFTYVYNTNNIFNKKKKKLKKKKTYKQYLNVVLNYYSHLLKNDYNYFLYNNNLSNKSSF